MEDNCNNITAIDSKCNNSTAMITVVVPKYNIALKFRALQIIHALAILIASVILNTLLLVYLKKRTVATNPQQRAVPTYTFVFCIGVVAIIVTLTGLPLKILLLVIDFQPYTVCDYINSAQYNILFCGTSLILHFISAILFDRFASLTNYKYKIHANNMKTVLAAIVIYVTAFWSVLVIRRIVGAHRHGERGLNACYYPMYVHFLLQREAENEAYGDTLIIAIWMTVCNTSFAVLTRKTLKAICKINTMAAQSPIGEQIPSLETRRVKVAFIIGILFNFIWIPFGIISLSQYRVDIKTASILKEFLVITGYTTFIVFPLVYAQMDKRYIAFLKQHIPCFKPQVVGCQPA